MFEALIITLREGVEAALVLAIALAILRRRGLQRLKGALFAGTAVALVLSAATAAAVSRLTYDQELAEGIAMLVGAALVFSLTWWMWKAAPHMKADVESGMARAAESCGSTAGVFLFAFGMVLREGVETAIFLSAAGFNSQGLGRWVGALLGLALAAVFGVLFARGTVKVPLKPFFSITTAVLALIGFQLLVGGLHELSEAQVLPASRAEMALIGPVVKNELLLFALTVGLVAVWLLGGRGNAPAAPAAAGEGPQARLERAGAAREAARRRWTGLVALVVMACLLTAFAKTARVPGRMPAVAIAAENGALALDPAALADHRAHFYQTTLGSRATRFFAIDVSGEVKVCLDACEICGDLGYFEEGSALLCRNCTSPIAISSLGRTGGCNPIPVAHRLEGGRVRIEEHDLAAALERIRGH